MIPCCFPHTCTPERARSTNGGGCTNTCFVINEGNWKGRTLALFTYLVRPAPGDFQAPLSFPTSLGENSGDPRLEGSTRKGLKPFQMWQVPPEIAFLWLRYAVWRIFSFAALVVAGWVEVAKERVGASRSIAIMPRCEEHWRALASTSGSCRCMEQYPCSQLCVFQCQNQSCDGAFVLWGVVLKKGQLG